MKGRRRSTTSVNDWFSVPSPRPGPIARSSWCAHRLSTLRDADRILVFDDGRIVETGTYMNSCGKGASLPNWSDQPRWPTKPLKLIHSYPQMAPPTKFENPAENGQADPLISRGVPT